MKSLSTRNLYDFNGRLIKTHSQPSSKSILVSIPKDDKKVVKFQEAEQELKLRIPNIETIEEAEKEETPLNIPDWARNPFSDITTCTENKQTAVILNERLDTIPENDNKIKKKNITTTNVIKKSRNVSGSRQMKAKSSRTIVY